MTKNVVSFQYAVGTNPYVSDINQNLSINSRFVAPPDLDDAGITAILAAVGGTLRIAFSFTLITGFRWNFLSLLGHGELIIDSHYLNQ